MERQSEVAVNDVDIKQPPIIQVTLLVTWFAPGPILIVSWTAEVTWPAFLPIALAFHSLTAPDGSVW